MSGSDEETRAVQNENTNLMNNQNVKQTKKMKILAFFKAITVEPAVLLFTIAMSLNGITTQSLTIRKFCLMEMGYPDEVCSHLTQNKTLEDQAQELATDFELYKTLLENLPTILLAAFFGTWSDNNGRKFLLILPTVGGGIGMIIMIFNAYYVTEMNVNYILVASVPYALGGNTLSVLMAAYAYIADITSISQRTIRFGFVQAAYLCGLPAGVSSGGFIFDKFGYVTVYVVNLILYVITLLYILIFVKESINGPTGQTSKYASLFKLSNVKENMAAVCKKRENNGRFHLALLIATAAISFLPLYAEYNVTYLYARWKFEWSEVTYSNYSSCVFVACLLGAVKQSSKLLLPQGLTFVMPFMSLRLRMQDAIIGILSSIAKVASELIIAFSSQGWMLFACKPLGQRQRQFFLFFPIYFTLLSNLFGYRQWNEYANNPYNDVENRKVTAVMSAAEAAMPAIGSVMFTQVYNMTRLNFAGAIYVMSGVLALLPVICFGWIYAQRINLTTIIE
uniref:Major facilitator superfamily (MFS) profile domain-containing protein n=1 Tax=Strigamia maritima TaxID=126957 RepID=T1J6Y9_STRMM